MNEQVSLTLRIVSHGHANRFAWLALIGMILMIGGMVAMMWFLSTGPTLDVRGWLCGGASIAGLFLWRAMLPQAEQQDRIDEAAKK